MRIKEIDIIKGIGTFLVMLGHSYVQTPFNSLELEPWSMWLNNVIYGFHMPLFFLASGFLFNPNSQKPAGEQLRTKALRLLLPYFCVTLLVMSAKLVSPQGMNPHPLATSVWGNLKFLFVDGGNRWFAYILFWVFAIAILLRHPIHSNSFRNGMAAALFIIVALFPTGYVIIDWTLNYTSFFLLGITLREHYEGYVKLMNKGWYVTLSAMAFVALNVIPAPWPYDILDVQYIAKALVGANITWIACYHMSKLDETLPIMRYINYVGRYSLQFYLLLFPVAISAYVVGTLLNITNAAAITILMMIGQIIGITALVEITRRIPWLKYPLGY